MPIGSKGEIHLQVVDVYVRIPRRGKLRHLEGQGVFPVTKLTPRYSQFHDLVLFQQKSRGNPTGERPGLLQLALRNPAVVQLGLEDAGFHDQTLTISSVVDVRIPLGNLAEAECHARRADIRAANHERNGLMKPTRGKGNNGLRPP